MSQPGAFATASQKCTCREEQMKQQLTQPQPRQSTVYLASQQRIVRPSPIVPSKSILDSIHILRDGIRSRADSQLQQKLRQSYFVGVVSEHRSLVQWQEELCLWDHFRLGQALFYQLAVAKFEYNRIATLGQPIHVRTVIEQVLQMEEDLQDERVGLCKQQRLANNGLQNEDGFSQLESSSLSKVNDTNALLAKQAASCLLDNSAMLEDYFGIRFEERSQEDSNSKEVSASNSLYLTGLPKLLEGHAPAPHGLPLFLLRLATEVNWEEERPCFDAVCRELGHFYAEMPSLSDSDAACKAHIQHTLFPALSFLLVPSKKMDHATKAVTVLSNLYKVFERC